jgi:hypothetical protein
MTTAKINHAKCARASFRLPLTLSGPQYIGNPYWCNDNAAPTWQSQCN